MTVYCKNCATHYKGKFCPQCGQKASTARLTVGHILHEFWHNFTHTDKSILNLVKLLVIRPGTVIRDYIDGKRSRYFNPFTFFLLVTSLLIIVTKYVFHLEDELYHENDEFGFYIRSNINFIIFWMLPLMALIFMYIFFERKYNYAESVTVLIFCFSLVHLFQLVIALLYIPFVGLHYSTKGYTYILSYLFVAWALINFIRPDHFIGYFKCLLTAVLCYMLIEGLGVRLGLLYGGLPFDKVF